jgi:radical SAM superfamily enzyme YgiQ (UPF0313 family)
MDKVKIQLIQINNSYGNNHFIPYSIGLLQAYIDKYSEIKDRCDFHPFIYSREPLEDIVSKIGHVDILAISCYIWNWNISKSIAKEIRILNKDCLIIVGGPQIPDNSDTFLKENYYIDIAVHGEGEQSFCEIVEAYVNDKSYKSIKGISYFDRELNKVIHTEKRTELVNIDIIPSPYLRNTFKALMESNKVGWVASWETNRGCPYTCSYCYWGGRSRKIRQFETDRLFKEIDWFSDNKISLIFGCDSNFGILSRDIELTKILVDNKKQYGFPQTFRVCNAKNSDANVFNIGRLLNESGMSKGISLGIQSLSTEVLKNINRINIKMDVYQGLQNKYSSENISTYTELIMALPGETYESFIEGINTLLENGQHSQINIYNCTVLVNSELSEPEYVKKHGIQTVRIPVFQAHSSKNDGDIIEYEDIVISTNTMSSVEWRKAHRFSWAVLCFHFLGVYKLVAVFLHGMFKVKYSDFYTALILYANNHPGSCVGKELHYLDRVIDNVFLGIGFDQHIHGFGNVTWPPEEATFLRLSLNIKEVYKELEEFLYEFLLKNKIFVDHNLLEDVLIYQKAILKHYDDNIYQFNDDTLNLRYNVIEYIDSIIKGNKEDIKREDCSYTINFKPCFNGDTELFAREVVWYGRKGGKFLHQISKHNKL